MDKSRLIKLSLITLFFLFALSQYALHFKPLTDAIYHYDDTIFMVATLCLGVILSTAIYNGALAFYLRSKQHLYYALAQLSTLLFLVTLDSLYIAPFDVVFGLRSPFVFDVSQLLMLTFSLLFIQTFTRGYVLGKLDGLIKVIFILIMIDVVIALVLGHMVLFKLLPIFIPIWLVLSEASRLASKKDLPFYYLLYGWGIVLLMVAVEYVGFVDYTGIVFPFLHLALALDSIVLSLAISYKVKLLDDEARVQQSLLLQRSRLASMGEMISIVAHQWRQPLTFLSFSLMSIKKRCQDEEGVKLVDKASKQLQHMSKTIEGFSNFYNPSATKESFSVKGACENIMILFKPMQMQVEISVKEDFNLYGDKNEFEQVILNLINNAKDSFVQNETKAPRLTIMIDKPSVSIMDNAGGIDAKIADQIFEPYFTTKVGNDGIGLYIAKMVVEKKLSGTLTLKTDTLGSQFEMRFPV